MRAAVLVTATAWALVHCTIASASSLPSKQAVATYAERLLKQNYKPTGPGAELLVARGNEVLFREARGLADVEHGTRIKPDDLFDIASLTKQFVAASVLKLAEAGSISLADPLSKYVAGFPAGEKITIAELLNHTSGVANYTDMPQLTSKPLTSSELITALKSQPASFSPGSGWAYDNSGYVLLGAVIESATHMNWFAYVQRTLLQPLGMAHTGYIGDRSTFERMVHGYTLVDGKPVDTGAINETEPYADGGLVSNVDDLLRWNLALHEGKVLNTASYRAMITPEGTAAPELYGYGIRHNTLRGQTMLAHSGHVTGFSAFLLYVPASRTTVAILQNMDPDASLDDTPTSARRLAAFAIGKPYRDPRPYRVSAERLAGDQGRFGADPPGSYPLSLHGARILAEIDGKMMIARTGEVRKPLVATGPDSFASSRGLDRLTLERDRTGKVAALRFYPDGEGPGQRLIRTAGSSARLIALPEATLQRFAGAYAADGLDARVTVSARRLSVTLNGQQPPATLLPDSRDHFLIAEVDGSVTFSAEPLPRSMIMKQGNEEVVLKRVSH